LKGGERIEEIVAHPDFRVLATMNPGGDFGKKELSPALRNRFTEIYIPAIDSREDLVCFSLSLSPSFPPSLSPSLSLSLDFIVFSMCKTHTHIYIRIKRRERVRH
jgi:midasin